MDGYDGDAISEAEWAAAEDEHLEQEDSEIDEDHFLGLDD